MNGELYIVTSSAGTSDSIYVGYTTRQGDMLRLESASMVLRYEEVGVPGIATQPEKAVRLRPALAGPVYIPLTSVSAIVRADEKAWGDHLGISR